jgi:large subunit ribosomal protein L34e
MRVCVRQIPGMRPKEYRTLKKRERTVSRTYGGSRCGGCVRSR